MEVQAQILQAYLDERGSMFDFVVYFFIIDPRNSAVEAFYVFDKLSTSQQNKVVKQIDKMPPKEAGKRTQSFVGADDTDTNEKKPFKFDTLTGGKFGTNVKAQVELASFNSKGFTITVSLLEKKNILLTLHSRVTNRLGWM
jgi:hypothetical protein